MTTKGDMIRTILELYSGYSGNYGGKIESVSTYPRFYLYPNPSSENDNVQENLTYKVLVQAESEEELETAIETFLGISSDAKEGYLKEHQTINLSTSLLMAQTHAMTDTNLLTMTVGYVFDSTFVGMRYGSKLLGLIRVNFDDVDDIQKYLEYYEVDMTHQITMKPNYVTGTSGNVHLCLLLNDPSDPEGSTSISETSNIIEANWTPILNTEKVFDVDSSLSVYNSFKTVMSQETWTGNIYLLLSWDNTDLVTTPNSLVDYTGTLTYTTPSAYPFFILVKHTKTSIQYGRYEAELTVEGRWAL